MLSKLSIKARLTTIFVIFFGGSLCLYSYYVYKTVNDIFQSEFDLLLLDFSAEVADSVDFGLFGGVRLDSSQIRSDRKDFPFSWRETVIQIRDLQGRSLQKSRALGNQEIPLDEKDLPQLYRSSHLIKTWKPEQSIRGNSSFRQVSYRVISPMKPPIILQLAVPDRFVRDNSQRILRLFTFSIPIVLLISAILGYSYSAVGLSSLSRFMERLRSIGPKDLTVRLPLPPAKDEIQELSISINGLLERLEKAFSSQERFVADASHQLKTPLAILKGELEVLSKGMTTDASAQKHFASLGEEVDRLINLVNNLLILAQVDAGDSRLVLHELELDEVVTLAVQRLKNLAVRKNIRLRLDISGNIESLSSDSFKILGDSDLLASMFQSLIENAIKYTKSAQEISIELKTFDKTICVYIRDQGPGIPEKELTKVFERFYRVRGLRESGSGLGLSIARRIAELHHAQLGIRNLKRGGLEVSFEIKKI